MPRSKLIFISLILSFYSCAEKSTQLSSEPVAPSSVSAPEKKFDYSFEELHATANYLTALFRLRIDAQIAHTKPKKIYNCDPPDDDITVWGMQLKSLLDEQSPQNVLKDPKSPQRFTECEKTCMCGHYAELLQNSDPAPTKLIEEMNKKHLAMTDKQSLQCAKNIKNFCGSALHQHLKKMSQ